MGRAQTSALCINERDVSAQHAILRFSVERWTLRDLGSRNGTFSNGERLKPGEELTLREADQIAFGNLEQLWEVTDDEAPLAMAVPLDGGDPLLVEDEFLALPSSVERRSPLHHLSRPKRLLDVGAAQRAVTHLELADLRGRRTTVPLLVPRERTQKFALIWNVSEFRVILELRSTETSHLFLSHRESNAWLPSVKRRVADIDAELHLHG